MVENVVEFAAMVDTISAAMVTGDVLSNLISNWNVVDGKEGRPRY